MRFTLKKVVGSIFLVMWYYGLGIQFKLDIKMRTKSELIPREREEGGGHGRRERGRETAHINSNIFRIFQEELPRGCFDSLDLDLNSNLKTKLWAFWGKAKGRSSRENLIESCIGDEEEFMKDVRRNFEFRFSFLERNFDLGFWDLKDGFLVRDFWSASFQGEDYFKTLTLGSYQFSISLEASMAMTSYPTGTTLPHSTSTSTAVISTFESRQCR